MNRNEFTKKIRLQAWLRCEGKCENCGIHFRGKRPEYDHRIACEFGGTNELDNCQVLCAGCHRLKTFGADIPAIAKSNRIIARQAGIKKQSRFACSRSSPFKKRLDGTVVRRNGR